MIFVFVRRLLGRPGTEKFLNRWHKEYIDARIANDTHNDVNRPHVAEQTDSQSNQTKEMLKTSITQMISAITGLTLLIAQDWRCSQ